MRELRAQTRVCERAREYASRSLDGELSDFERALLDNHLERCPTCRDYAQELGQIVSRLRLAPLETLERPVALPPRRRRVRTGVLQIAAASAAAAVAATAGLVGAIQSHRPASTHSNVNLAAIIHAEDFHSQDVQELHQLRAAAQLPKTALARARRGQKPS
jgi:anti-sigma factor RsiW